MKLTNEIITWLLSGGFLIIFGIISRHLNAFLTAKKNHNKAVEEREVLGLVHDLADTAVTSLVGKNTTGQEKFEQATKMVQSVLNDKGFDVQGSTVNHAVQAAYEKSDLTSKKPEIESAPVMNNSQVTPAELVPWTYSTKDIPAAKKKAEAKPYSPETAKSIKGIPTGNLEDIAVQAPKKEEGADNGN